MVDASQCSLHNAPIFRLLLKVAVNGTHQCESHNFCGTPVPTGSIHSEGGACRRPFLEVFLYLFKYTYLVVYV